MTFSALFRRFTSKNILTKEIKNDILIIQSNITERELKMKNKNYIYFIQIGKEDENLYKIGTTNDIERRLKEHTRYYKKECRLIWLSRPYSKYTTLRVEEKTINKLKETEGFHYIKNDRFVLVFNRL